MDVSCHSRCGTLKNPHCSMAMSAEHRSKLAALHRQGWRLHMSEKFSNGTMNLKQTNHLKRAYGPSFGYIWSVLIGGYLMPCSKALKLTKWYLKRSKRLQTGRRTYGRLGKHSGLFSSNHEIYAFSHRTYT